MVASNKISVSWVVAKADMFYQDSRPTDAYMGAAGRHRLEQVPEGRMSAELKSYHRQVSLARDSAIYDAWEEGGAALAKPLVWLQVPGAVAPRTTHAVLDLGKRFDACLVGALVGVHNPRTRQVDYFALAQRL